MDYEKITSEQESTEFFQQIFTLPFIQSAKKVYFTGKDPVSKRFILKNPLWLEWCGQHRDFLIGSITFVKLLENNASDEELQKCVDDYLLEIKNEGE